MVPHWLPGPRSAWNLGSALAEAVSAALLVSRRTSRLGGAVAAGTFTVVFVANLQAVVDGGMRGLPGWLSTREAAILRLPLQVPLVWWAWRLTRPERSEGSGGLGRARVRRVLPGGVPTPSTGALP